MLISYLKQIELLLVILRYNILMKYYKCFASPMPEFSAKNSVNSF